MTSLITCNLDVKTTAARAAEGQRNMKALPHSSQLYGSTLAPLLKMLRPLKCKLYQLCVFGGGAGLCLTSMASCDSWVVLVRGTSCTRPVMSSAVLFCISGACLTGF